MYKILLIFILTITLFASKEKETYTVAFLKDWKTYYITDEKSNLDGYVFELFEAISKKTNLQFKYIIINDWKELIELSKSGEIDIAPNVGITKDRELMFSFSQPTDTFKIKFFKRKDSIHIENKEDLRGKAIGMMEKNICNKLILEDFTKKKVIFTSLPRLISALSSGELDAICYPETLLNSKLTEMNLTNKIVSFDKSIKEVKRGVGVTKDNFELLAIINEAISEIKINGDFQKIYTKWFGEEEKFYITKESYEKILIGVCIIILILLFVIFWNNKLKKEYKIQEELKNKLKLAQKIAKLGHYTYYYKSGNFTCSEEINRIFGINDNTKKDTDLWLNLIYHEDIEKINDYWEYTLTNNVDFEFEYRIVNKKTQEIIWVLGLGKITRDKNQNPIQMFGTIQDINDRKKMEENLNQAMMVFENTHDGIMITDKDINIINVNKSFETTTGYSLSEVINKKPSILSSNLNGENFYKTMWENLNTKGVWSGEIINKNKNKKTYYELLTINTIYNQNKNITGYIGIFTDITQNKTSEKMLIRQSKVAAVGEMLGNISHQWRQPLSVISTHATGLKLNIELNNDIDKDFIMKSMDEINKQSQYLSKTIDDFRSFFKGNSKDVFTFNIKQTFIKLENLTKDMLNNNFINYKSEIIDLELTKNENLLIQALINIYNNSKDAMIEYEKIAENRYLFVTTKIKDNSLEISIKDTGGGICPNIKDKIFDPYFTTKHQSIGTGIGLYMTHQIITKQFKGKIFTENVDIEIKNQILKGTEFKLILPIV